MTNQSITEENYHLDTTHISKSGLDKINKSPNQYYQYYLGPHAALFREKKKTKALLIGEVFHCALMEPHLFFKRYIVGNGNIDKRTKEGKALYYKYVQAGKGKKYIDLNVYNTALAMRAAVYNHPIANKLFKRGTAEKIHTFVDPETGIKCKIKPDWETPERYLVDLKSALDASCDFSNDETEYNDFGQIIPQIENGFPVTNKKYSGFPKSVFNYRYDVQDAFYSDGYGIATGQKAEAFIFVAVEKEPPFEVSLYVLSDDIKAGGRAAYKRNLATLKQCRETNNYPGYPTKIIKII